MPIFLPLTDGGTNRPVFVNPSQIQYFYWQPSMAKTYIFFEGKNLPLEVLESVEDLLNLLNQGPK